MPLGQDYFFDILLAGRVALLSARLMTSVCLMRSSFVEHPMTDIRQRSFPPWSTGLTAPAWQESYQPWRRCQDYQESGQNRNRRGKHHRRRPKNKSFSIFFACWALTGDRARFRFRSGTGIPRCFLAGMNAKRTGKMRNKKGRCQTTPAMRSSETSSEQCSRSAKNDHDQRAETSSGIPGLIVDAMEALVM